MTEVQRVVPGTATIGAGDAFADPRPGTRSLGSVAWALALARGAPPPALVDPPCWESIWTVALDERLAVLAWLRSAPVIRQHAPAPIQSRWRAHALTADARARLQLGQLEEALEALRRDGIRARVLKGLPLSVTLYGDMSARVCTDIDLHVEAECRADAQRTLERLGWRLRYGAAPWDQTFERDVPARSFLELHSLLVHDGLAHIPMGIGATRECSFGSLVVSVPTWPMLPAYLAAHAAIHDRPPLLWFLDLSMLWKSGTEMEREGALREARDLRLERVLEWALVTADAVLEAASGRLELLERVGFSPDGARRDSPLRRIVGCASTPVDAARSFAAVLWPRPLRWGPRALMQLMGRRVKRRLLGERTASAPAQVAVGANAATASRGLDLDRDAFVPLVRDVVAAGRTVWVHVRGASMAPAVPPGSLVRLSPLPARSLLKGDVVLALTSTGLPVLHRVRGVGTALVRLRGDALPEDDPPVPIGNVLALADVVRTPEGEMPMPRRGRRAWRRMGLHWYRRVLRPTKTR